MKVRNILAIAAVTATLALTGCSADTDENTKPTKAASSSTPTAQALTFTDEQAEVLVFDYFTAIESCAERDCVADMEKAGEELTKAILESDVDSTRNILEAMDAEAGEWKPGHPEEKPAKDLTDQEIEDFKKELAKEEARFNSIEDEAKERAELVDKTIEDANGVAE